MNYEIHTLAWENADRRMIDAHRSVIDHFRLPVNYHRRTVPHGLWMTRLLERASCDVVGFLDLDCVPLNREIVISSIRQAFEQNSFVGVAQASNHLSNKAHIFAAPAFFFIKVAAWHKLGRPSFAETARSDVAQEVSYIAEERGLRYRALYPQCYEDKAAEGVWRLGNYGFFGIGTVFEGGVYHLYQGRYPSNLARFETRCAEIVAGTFSTAGFHSAQQFPTLKPVVP